MAMRVKLIYLDFETTGLKEPAAACEAAFIDLDIDTFEEIGRHHSLIDPQLPISATASGIHHITDDMVQEAPTLAEWFDIVLNNPFNGVDLVIVAAHNVKYDFDFIEEFVPENTKLLCTLKLARRVWPDLDDHKLATLKYHFKLGKGASHNALADVETGVKLLRLIAQETGMGLDELLPFQDAPRILKCLNFGKHKDEPIEKIPRSYVLWWLNSKPLNELDPDILSTFKHHFPALF